jgi:hypothetical protein
MIEALGVFGLEMLAGITIMILNVISSIYAFKDCEETLLGIESDNCMVKGSGITMILGFALCGSIVHTC